MRLVRTVLIVVLLLLLAFSGYLNYVAYTRDSYLKDLYENNSETLDLIQESQQRQAELMDAMNKLPNVTCEDKLAVSLKINETSSLSSAYNVEVDRITRSALQKINQQPNMIMKLIDPRNWFK